MEQLRALREFEIIDPKRDWTYYIDDLNDVRRRILRDAEVPMPRRALDVGTGDGWWVLAMRELGPAVAGVAIELAANEAANAAGRAHKLGVNDVSFLSMDAYRMGFADSSFDLAGSFLAIQDICASRQDLERVLAETHRVLAPGGTFILTTVTPEDAENESQRLGIELYQYIRAGYFAKADLRAALSGAGFTYTPERFYYTGVNLGLEAALEFVKFQCGWWVDTYQMPTVDWRDTWAQYKPRIQALGGLEVDAKLTVYVARK